MLQSILSYPLFCPYRVSLVASPIDFVNNAFCNSIKGMLIFHSSASMTTQSEQAPKQDRVHSALCTSAGNLSIVDDKNAATLSGSVIDWIFSSSHSHRRQRRLSRTSPSLHNEIINWEKKNGFPCDLWEMMSDGVRIRRGDKQRRSDRYT